MDTKPSIVSYCTRGDACYWYRNKMPLDALARKGWKTSTIPVGDLSMLENVDIIQISRVVVSTGNKFDAFLFDLKDKGKKIWYDIDDAVDLVTAWNPYGPINRANMSSFYFMLNQADFITTTNARLAGHLAKMTPKPIMVFPNCINPAEWNMRPMNRQSETTEGLRVGFAGSPSHVKDLNMILPVIKDLQKRYNFTFVMFGMGGEDTYEAWMASERAKYAEDWQTYEYCIELEKMSENLKDINLEWQPAKRWEMYPARLASLDLDIGLCPLIDDEFNECKSPIKMYEYAMVGTMTIASNVVPFSGESLVTAENTYESWFETLDAACIHADLRLNSAEKQREYVLANKTIDANISKLEDILARHGQKD